MERFLILSLFVVIFLVSSANCETSTYIMDQNCDKTIKITRGAVLLKLTANSNYSANTNCRITVRASTLFMTRIMLKVLSLDMEYTTRCDADSLKIYNGMTTSSSLLTRSIGICGVYAPYAVYKSSGLYVTLKFKSDSSIQKKGFKILITPFDDSGVCLSTWDYRCDNSYCIDKSLKCDGYNNCGDNSEEKYCYPTTTSSYMYWPSYPNYFTGYTGLSLGAIVGIVFGCIAGVIIIVVVVVGLACRGASRSRAVRGQAQTAATNRAYIPTEQPNAVMASPGQVPTGQYHPQNKLPPAYDVVYSTASQAVNVKSQPELY